MPAAALAVETRRCWLSLLAEGAAFAIYFWCSGLLPMWKGDWEE